MTTRPWKVILYWPQDSTQFVRSYASGEAAFDAAGLLRGVTPDVKVKNVETGEIWTWDDAASPTPVS